MILWFPGQNSHMQPLPELAKSSFIDWFWTYECMTDKNRRMPGSLGDSSIMILPFFRVQKRYWAILHTSLAIFVYLVYWLMLYVQTGVCSRFERGISVLYLSVSEHFNKRQVRVAKNSLGTAVAVSLSPAFSIFLASPSGLCLPCQWRYAARVMGTVGRALSMHIQPSFQHMGCFTSASPSLWEKLQWEPTALNYLQDLNLLVKTPAWKNDFWAFLVVQVWTWPLFWMSYWQMKIALEKRSEFGL